MANYGKYSDVQLAGLLKEGDKLAFAEIYDRYKGVLYIHALKMLKDADDAQDVLQEIFANLWEKAASFDLEVPLKLYLYRSVKNRVINIFEHRQVRSAYVTTFQSVKEQGAWSTDEKLLEKELIQVIESEIAKLPPKMREVFKRSRIEHQSHRQIAEELGISEKTVKKQISNAIKIIRPRMDLITIFLHFFGF